MVAGGDVQGVPAEAAVALAMKIIHEDSKEEWRQWAALFDGFVHVYLWGDVARDVCAHR